MATELSDSRSGVRFEADENPPLPLTFGLGLQLAVLAIGGIVLTPAIIIRAAGGSDAFLAWAVFAAVAVSGLTTVLQAVRVGRIGAGYVLLMGTSGAFIAVSVTALAEGGPAMLATLIVISSLFQFALSTRLSLFRRILTPTVVGTVIMLIAVTVMPIAFDMLKAQAAGRTGNRDATDRRGNALRHPGHRSESDRSAQAMGAGHRRDRGFGNRRVFRHVRHRPDRGGRLDRHSRVRLAGLRPRIRARVLEAPAGLRLRHAGWRHGNHRRCHGDPGRLVAATARRRFPRGTGRGSRGRHGQPTVRACRNRAQHHLFQQRRGHGTDRRLGPGSGSRHRLHFCGPGIFCRRRWPSSWPSRTSLSRHFWR